MQEQNHFVLFLPVTGLFLYLWFEKRRTVLKCLFVHLLVLSLNIILVNIRIERDWTGLGQGIWLSVLFMVHILLLLLNMYIGFENKK